MQAPHAPIRIRCLTSPHLAPSRPALPRPAPPPCSATLTLYGGKLVPYELDEARGWALDVEDLKAGGGCEEARGIWTATRGKLAATRGH